MAKLKFDDNPLIIKKDNGKDTIIIDYSRVKKVAQTLRAINHPFRQTLLSLMDKNREIVVTDIYSKLKVEQSVTSQHLGILRRAGLVTTKRNGKYIYYSVNKKGFAQVINFVERLSLKSNS